LIERIADEHLRKAIQEEVRSLRNSREFGLVFERHFPENVSLPSHPIRRGARVTLRNSDTLEPIGVVLSVAGSEASVMDEKGGICRLPVDQLVVVKMFGEAVYPGLEDLGHVGRPSEHPPHIIINGENYHALQALQYIYEAS